ncbi:hypothetical protein K2173_018135 [Erythroxylum novogranatense]|uniref:Uncharacterized protein n=1 Tax=Erythroxylum novogranatense TaxID=1862640 RepID=A0AAV8U6G1_9ROSI|nr:hypothetical protein K2173_018135 [Erythroxylum novogranatense]
MFQVQDNRTLVRAFTKYFRTSAFAETCVLPIIGSINYPINASMEKEPGEEGSGERSEADREADFDVYNVVRSVSKFLV